MGNCGTSLAVTSFMKTRHSLPEPLPATAPELLLGLRDLFDSRISTLQNRAKEMLSSPMVGNSLIRVPFAFRGMMVSAFYDPAAERFTELRACDIGEVEEAAPSYELTISLR